MELFAAMQIAAYQRKRTVRYIFFRGVFRKCLPLLTAEAVQMAARALVEPFYSPFQPCARYEKRL